MLAAVLPISSLLLGMAILLVGSGMVGTLLGLRASHEAFSEATIGLVMSGFFAGYIVGALVCPKLIRRVGHIRAFTALAATAACGALLYGLVVDPLMWFGLRLLNGMCVVGLYMVIESWLNEQVGAKRARVFSVYMMVCLAAQGLGQYMLLIYGPLGLSSFALVAMLFTAGLIPVALTPVAQPAPVQRVQLISFRRLYSVAPVGVAGALVSGVVMGAFWALAAVYARLVGLGDAGAAHLIAAAIFSGVVVQWPIGRASDRMDRRVVLTRVSLLSAIGCTAMLIPGLAELGVIAAAAWFGAFGFSLYGLAVAQTHDRFQSGGALEATKGLLLLHGIGAASGPVLTGVLMQAFGARAFPVTLSVILVLLAAYVGLRIRRDAPVPVEDRGTFVPVTRTSEVALELDPRSKPV